MEHPTHSPSTGAETDVTPESHPDEMPAGIGPLPELISVRPETLDASAYHIRAGSGAEPETETDSFQGLVRSIRRNGIINPPLVRHENVGEDTQTELRVVDGMRRVRAAGEAGIEWIDVLVYPWSPSQALMAGLTLHTDAFENAVSEADRQVSLRRLVGGPSTPVQPWEETRAVEDDMHRARSMLGLDGERARLAQTLSDVPGVGSSTLDSLHAEFETFSAVEDASVAELQSASGVGPRLADRVRRVLDGAVPGYECPSCGWTGNLVPIREGEPWCSSCACPVEEALIFPAES